jgi:hypothetical protein
MADLEEKGSVALQKPLSSLSSPNPSKPEYGNNTIEEQIENEIELHTLHRGLK